MKKQCMGMVLLFAAFIGAAGGAGAEITAIPRVLLVGDSWAGFTQAFKSYDAAFAATPELARYRQIGYMTAIMGGRASELNTPTMLGYIANELDKYPTLDIVHLSLGGNDVLWSDGWHPWMTPQQVQALWDNVIANIQAVVDLILAKRPDIRIYICGYDYANHEKDNATTRQLNDAFVSLELAKREFFAQPQYNNRVFYVHNFGMMQWTYGDAEPVNGLPGYAAHTVPLPGDYPGYTPWPGGNPDYNSPLEALIDLDIHLTQEGYQILIQRCIDQFAATWLSYPRVIEILPMPGKAAEAQFQVTFSEDVTGVDATDFTAASGKMTHPIISVTGSGAVYTVATSASGATGPVRLAVVDDGTIVDGDGHPLQGELDGGYAVNGPMFYDNPQPPASDDFEAALRFFNIATGPYQEFLGGFSFNPAVCDSNGGITSIDPLVINGNGLLDSFEFAVIKRCLDDDTLDLSASGGVTHSLVQDAWDNNFAHMTVNCGGADGLLQFVLPGTNTFLAGLMTLGDTQSAALPVMLLTALCAVREFPPTVTHVTAPNQKDYILLPQYLGLNGDADGDGFTNRQEYDYFAPGGRDAYLDAVLNPNIVPESTEGEGGGEGEGEGGGGEGEGETEGETPAELDFCAIMDDIYNTTQSEIMAPLLDLLGDDASLISLILCDVADLNGPFVDTDTPPDGSPDMPGPNGMLDGAYELNVIAELINNPSRYAELPSGTASGQGYAGVDPVAVASAYAFNYSALYDPLEALLPVIPILVQNLAHVTLTEEQTEEILSLFPNLLSILAGYATLGDVDSLSVVLFLTDLLHDFAPALPTTGDGFITLNGILGPNGDADGDGYTNRQEYNYFTTEHIEEPECKKCAKTFDWTDPKTYIRAVLNPRISPAFPEGMRDFCKTMNDIYATAQSETLAPLLDLLGDDASLISLILCDTADLNGPFVDTDTPPDGSPDMPGPNGMLDGAYELGVIAELINFPGRYAGLASGSLSGQVAAGVDAALVGPAFEANYLALYAPLESLLPVLPIIVQNLAHITLTEDQTEEILSLFPNLLSVLAGYATLGDADSLSVVLFLTNLLHDFAPALPTTPDGFVTLNGILGPDGDADGDGFTNRQEYNSVPPQDARAYVAAALDPGTHQTPGEGEGEGEGGVEGEGPAEGEGQDGGEGEGAVEGEGTAEGGLPSLEHSADPDGNGIISLSELLRVIQFFNSGGFHCQAGTEDGYAPGPGDESCLPHSSDYNEQDWHINLSELLRLIQFFNSGGYHACPGENTEDGFCPGLD